MLWRNFSASVKGDIYHVNPHLAQRINVRVSYISLPYSYALKADEQVVIQRRQSQTVERVHPVTCCYCSGCFML